MLEHISLSGLYIIKDSPLFSYDQTGGFLAMLGSNPAARLKLQAATRDQYKCNAIFLLCLGRIILMVIIMVIRKL